MATITAPAGGWEQYANIYEFYDEAGTLPVHHIFEFGVSLKSNESLVSIGTNINVQIEDYGGSRVGHKIDVKFIDYFEKNGATIFLKYRDRKSLQISSVNGFSNLPVDATSCDVIEFNPPAELTANIIYTPSATIKTTDPNNPTLPPKISVVSATFTQTLHGSYQGWTNKLTGYINKSGPFPRI